MIRLVGSPRAAANQLIEHLRATGRWPDEPMAANSVKRMHTRFAETKRFTKGSPTSSTSSEHGPMATSDENCKKKLAPQKLNAMIVTSKCPALNAFIWRAAC